MSTLFELSCKGSLDEIKAYIQNNQYIPRKKYNAAIIQAAIRENLDIIEFLYEKGANINSKTNTGNSVMDIIMDKLINNPMDTTNLKQIFKFLIENDAKKHQSISEPFVMAGNMGFLDIIKYMLDKGIDINIKNGLGFTALSLSCDKNRPEVSKFLIEKGADINLSDNFGVTPLHIACSSGNLDIVKLLLEKGADLHKKCRHNLQPIFYSIRSENIDLIKFLIENGADVNNTEKSGRTPLMSAVNLYENYEVIKLLLENGADPNVKGKWGDKIDINRLCPTCKELILSYMNKPKPIELDLPDIECFDEVEHSSISIREFMKTTDQILIRIGNNLKGYNRSQLISYYEKNNTLYSREAISSSDFEKIRNNDYLFFSMINTGIETVLLTYSTEKFFS